MNFIPYLDKIEIRPLRKDSLILSESESLIEAGEVLSVGESVTFVKPGDIVYFDSYGCSKTPEIDGVQRYVVSQNSNVILGKNGE